MIIKEKRYIKKCDCGTEIIYTRRDCYHNTTWDIYSLYCPSCSREYSYRRGTHHDLFDKEYEEDSVDKDKEIERLNNIIKEQGLEDKPNYYVKGLEGSLKEYQEEIERLNNIINEFNSSYYKIIKECEEMINDRYYMNENAIKYHANRIRDIAKYYVEEPKW